MNLAHLHLILVHVPIGAIPIITLLLIYGMLYRKQELTSAALRLYFLVALITVPAYLAGEGAEELIEHLPEIVENNIERHEDSALFAFIAVLCTGALSITTLFLNRIRDYAHPILVKAVLFFAILTIGLLAWTGNLGGLIRHPEIKVVNET